MSPTEVKRWAGRGVVLAPRSSVCDAAGRLVNFLLAPGQAHELAPSLTLLHRLPQAPAWVLADMACDARAFRSDVRAMGAIPVVPPRRGTKQPEPCPDYIYRHRNLIERCWSRFEGAVGHRDTLRQDRDVLCGGRCYRCITGLDHGSGFGKHRNANGP